MAPTVPIEFTGQKQSRKFLTSQVMGKSRKFSSKRPSTGFIPDYRHAVETIAESDGFGISARVDTEMTASDDSYGHKRKCISLNVDGTDSFGVPVQVLSLSNLSNIERRALKSRLLKELEQVQNLQRRLTSAAAVSPSGNMRSCSDVQKRPLADGTGNPGSLGAVRNGKKRAGPPKAGSRPTKKSNVELSEAVRPAGAAGSSNAIWVKQCEAIVTLLLKHKYSWVFREPVDVEKLNIPDYFHVIKHPMDLGTVKSKLLSSEYSNPQGFAADVRLTFANAMTYNPPGNDVHVMADVLSKNFETKWKEIEKKLSLTAHVQAPPLNSVAQSSERPPPKKKKKVLSDGPWIRPELDVRPTITDDEKRKLSMELEALLGELPDTIVDFLKEQSSSADQTSEDEIEIDIDALGDNTLLKLRKLLDEYLLERQNKQGRAEACELELHNEPGVSNSSPAPFKGNEGVDEDVDIVGGNDPPMSSFPPVEIEKDAAQRNSKCSSPSSSSSDSGSSSSDSDSAGSSESEPDAIKASAPEFISNGDGADRKRSDIGDLDTGNSPIDVVGLVEENLLHEQISNDECGPDEEENAPSERHVSPEKLYRAALLRNRFADTILKAQEKTLEKDEKRDPEKLRREREELEKRLKEEVKAAEEARKKAEAKAAEDAKKKRELERELARQALQKMEKTVDINENSQFLEDLELLRAANDECIPNFLEEASPAPSENHLGSFKLQASSNPLEQLGLFMKDDDDDDDDDGDPPQSMPPPNDVEDGEID